MKFFRMEKWGKRSVSCVYFIYFFNNYCSVCCENFEGIMELQNR